MADLADEGFEPLPALTEPLDPDADLALQDALADGPLADPAEIVPPAPLGRAPAYDFAEHRLIPGVAGGPLMTRGRATLATWIEKCLRTRRGENPAVNPDFGVDVTASDVLEEGEPFDASLIAEYAAAIRRALVQHPRITSVDDIQITGDSGSDTIVHDFGVVTDGEDEADLNINGLRIGS